ncbi:MAG TPA: DUF5723 family protein [Bacteroidota bacterium]|nr:DUF5723 family protein [Bacteroidota bacterium]
MNNVYERRSLVVVGLVILLGIASTRTTRAGEDRVSGQIIGMARTFTASSRGLDAIGLNPANLALDDRGSWVTFEIAPFGFRAGSDLLNYGIYQDYFTGQDSLKNGQPVKDKDGNTIRVGKLLSQSDKDAILGLFPGGVAHTQVDFDITEFGFTVHGEKLGGIGFSVSDQVGVNMDIPEGYLKMALDAFPASGASYSLDNTSVTASWLREYNLSYARMLPVQLSWAKEIAVGIGIKYVQGFGYFGTDHYTGSIQVAPSTFTTDAGQVLPVQQPLTGNVNFLQYQSHIPFQSDSIAHYMTKPAGTGIGFDLGVSGQFFQGLRLAASVTDIGKVTWNKFTKAIVGSGGFTVSDIQDQDSVKNAFKGSTRDTTSFKTSLPTALNLGAAFQLDQAPFITHFPGRLLVAADLHFGFNNEPGNSTSPRFSLGTEYRPIGMLPIRTGISIGGRERFSWALGMGINTPVWDLDFGTESIALLTSPNSFRNGSFTLGMRFRI